MVVDNFRLNAWYSTWCARQVGGWAAAARWEGKGVSGSTYYVYMVSQVVPGSVVAGDFFRVVHGALP